MQFRIQTKIDMFHESFGLALEHTGPTYNTQGGLVLCDPPPKPPTTERNWVLGDSYEKLTNFIKVSPSSLNLGLVQKHSFR